MLHTLNKGFPRFSHSPTSQKDKQYCQPIDFIFILKKKIDFFLEEMANTPLGYCPCHSSKHTRQFLNFELVKNSDELERRRECLVCNFKQLFLVFKQYFTYFNTFFHPHVFLQMFSNNNFQFLNTCTKRALSISRWQFLCVLIAVNPHHTT